MIGETNLQTLLKSMQPELQPGSYVFCTLPSGSLPDSALVIGSFREKEGLTVILSKSTADTLGLSYSLVTSWISLTIHSALDVVGFTAAFATALTKAEISCNVMAGYYHDHLFVPPPGYGAGDAGLARVGNRRLTKQPNCLYTNHLIRKIIENYHSSVPTSFYTNPPQSSLTSL